VTVDVRSRAEAGLSSPSPFSYLTGATEETDAAWIYRNKKKSRRRAEVYWAGMQAHEGRPSCSISVNQ
jgi:hypothetical protein